MLMRLLRLLGSRRLTDILLLGWAAWLLLLLAWSQTSPGEVVQNIGTMTTFQVLYGLVAANLLACFLVELPRIWRRCQPRALPTAMPPPGYESVETEWADANAAAVALKRRFYRVSWQGDRMLADRGRFGPLWGMLFHLLLPLLVPTIIWAVSARRTASIDVGVGEVVPPQPDGPQVALGVSKVDVSYLRDEIFFTELAAEVTVNGRPAGRIRINDPIKVDGGQLRIGSMGFMPAIEVSDPAGRLLEGAWVKASLFPPGTEAELGFPNVPHRLYAKFYPDAAIDEYGEAQNDTLNLRRPALHLRAVRNKLPVGAKTLRVGEVLEVDRFRFGFGAVDLWVKLDWVYDPGTELTLLLLALATLLIALRVLWPRTTWVAERRDGELIVARRVEAFAAFTAEEEDAPSAKEEGGDA